MRIITRADFDGIVCAVLLSDALNIQNPILWVEPNDMQTKRIPVLEGDIIANLSYHENCSLWFDHHESNRIREPFNGVFKSAPSAAGIIFEVFKNFDKNQYQWAIPVPVRPFRKDYSPLVAAADKIDSAQLLPEEVIQPSKNPYVALSMTISSHNRKDEPYWNRLIHLLKDADIQTIIEDPDIQNRLSTAEEKNKTYTDFLTKYTTMKGNISITDFRSLNQMPSGNRFLVFSLFPQCVVNVKIRYHDETRQKVVVNIGHSIFNRKCNVSSGILCSRFGGGGHFGAGSCSFTSSTADPSITYILEVLEKNEPI